MSSDVIHTAWCEILTDRIANNLSLALSLLPEHAEFCAVLKADAYGHGIAEVAAIVCEHRIKTVGITSNAEARLVREAGFEGTILRLRTATPSEIAGAVADRVQEQVSSLYTAEVIDSLTEHSEGVHLAINAGGMSRDGLELNERDGHDTCQRIVDLLGDRIVGICTHHPSGSEQDLQLSDQHFRSDLNWIFSNTALKREQVNVHAGSSLSLISSTPIETDFYRCGAILYGILKPELGFEHTMQLKAQITNITTYPQGSTIGYDRTTTLTRDSRVANIALGYANGFRRNYFGRSHVLIRGQLVPVLGKVSMNTIVADVTDIPVVEVEDEVVIFGHQGTGKIDIKRIEMQADTIMADIYAEWGQRNPRVYI
ncbi:alanine racemase [Reinekea blandensis]|uniref:Alanine racemase n=1 Tax=Reinekea blandensis MED297 TaxID=314283 RepID=A4BIE9_9GAMM|nr:alanine racemase [Reinekea blandensis]EAR08156.1 alanine racemase [Reinekea sp. MED297] [Reinekea blandensis MED297]